MNSMRRFCQIAIIAFALIAFVGCQQKSKGGACHIKGTTDETLEGKKMYLVPLIGPATDETVDSTVVINRKFEFFTDSNKMAIIRPAYYDRAFSQDLLVVTEPGEIEVSIDTVSSSRGTPNNNRLQQWKEDTEKQNALYVKLLKEAGRKLKAGDSVARQRLRQTADSVHNEYVTMTRAMADSLDEGPLKRFFLSLYPKKSPKK